MKLQAKGHLGVTVAAFTLVEAVISVLLVGILSVSLYAGFSSGFAAIQTARENLRATQILVQRMESVRLLTWSQLLDTNRYFKPVYFDYYDPTGANTNWGERYTAFVKATIPTNVPSSYATNMRDVTITLYWTNRLTRQATPHWREMSTRVARYGMQNYIYGQ